jgi:coproporphyrinogen III oxidase-like Fe-S oxidoreductase
MTKTVYKLKEQINNIPKGTLFFKGSWNEEEKAFEYFDMTTEMLNGNSYSHYRIEEYLEPSSSEEEQCW